MQYRIINSESLITFQIMHYKYAKVQKVIRSKLERQMKVKGVNFFLDYFSILYKY